MSSYAVVEISPKAFEEIRSKLEEAGYEDQFETDARGRAILIDMNGIALQAEGTGDDDG